MIDILLDVVVPAFIVVGVGIVLGRAFRLDAGPLNRVALYGAVPSLVFVSLSTSDVAFDDVGLLLAANTLFLLGMAGVASAAAWLMPAAARRGLVATSMFGNAANIMLPVTLFAFGDAGLQRALILYVFSAVVLFTLGPLVLGGRAGGSRRRFLVVVLRLPVLWAALLGVGVNLAGWTVPVGLERGVGLLGDAAIPLVLVLLGLQIERTGVRLPSGVNVVGAFLKLAVGPLVGYASAWLLGVRGLDLAVLTLLAAMPPAVNIFMLALEFGADADEVARTVIVSTLASVVSLTLVLAVVRTFVG
jgi:malate permease and related proteins